MSALAAGIAATATTIASLLAARQAKKARQENRDLMAIQNQYNVDNFNRTNEYNSPSAQMARLKAAGLSPNLIYQNGGASIGAGDIGSVQSDGTHQADYTSAINHGLDIFDAGIQSDSVKAEIDKKKAETENITADTISKGISNKFLPREYRLKLRGLSLQNSQYNAQTNLISQQRDYYSKLTGLTDQQISNASLEYPRTLAEIQNLHDQHKINGVEFKRLNKLCNQIDKQSDLITKQAMQAYLNNSLLNMRLLANRGKNNEFTMALDQLEETVNQLHFYNSDVYRSNILAPRGFGDAIFKAGNQLSFDLGRKYKYYNRY